MRRKDCTRYLVSVVLCIVFLFQPCTVLARQGVTIDCSYLRKLSSLDNGTSHLFLRNGSGPPVLITQVYLDDESLPYRDPLGISVNLITDHLDQDFDVVRAMYCPTHEHGTYAEAGDKFVQEMAWLRKSLASSHLPLCALWNRFCRYFTYKEFSKILTDKRILFWYWLSKSMAECACVYNWDSWS